MNQLERCCAAMRNLISAVNEFSRIVEESAPKIEAALRAAGEAATGGVE